MATTIASSGRGTAFGSFILLNVAIQDPMMSKSLVFPFESSISEQLRGSDFRGKGLPVVLPLVEKSQISNAPVIPADMMNVCHISLLRKTSPSMIPEVIVDPPDKVFSCAVPDSCHNEPLPKAANTSAPIAELQAARQTLDLARKAYRKTLKYHDKYMRNSEGKREHFTKKEISHQLKVVKECRSNVFKLDYPEIAVLSEVPALLTKKEAKLILDRYNEQHGKSMPCSIIDVAQPTKKQAKPPATVVPVKPDPEATNQANTARTESQARAKKRQKKKIRAEKQNIRANKFKKAHPEINNVPSRISLTAKKKLLAAAAAAAATTAQDAENKAPPRRVSQRIANHVTNDSDLASTELSKRGSTAHDPITLD